MKLKSKGLTIAIAVLLCVALMCIFATSKLWATNEVAAPRDISMEQSALDNQSIFDSFEDAKLTTIGAVTFFEGKKALDSKALSTIDYISEEDFDAIPENAKVKYNFSYDNEINIVTLKATMIMPDGTYEIDEISGVGFINEKNEIDAVMNVEGESVLLSELRDAGMIENCGWFSRLIKRVATVVAVAAAVVAAAAVIVCTAGTAAPAVVAAGIGVTTTVVTAAATTAATIASVSMTVAAIAAGVAITAQAIELVWDNISYKLEKFDNVKTQLLKGFYYLAVTTKDGGMLVTPVRLPSVVVAAAAFNAGLSVYSPDSVEAFAVATTAGGGIPALDEGKVHGYGYFRHYHRWDHKPRNSHAFWGLPVF